MTWWTVTPSAAIYVLGFVVVMVLTFVVLSPRDGGLLLDGYVLAMVVRYVADAVGESRQRRALARQAEEDRAR